MRQFIQLFAKILFITGIFIISTNSGFSQASSKKSTFSPSWTTVPFERKAFIENKGQFDHLISEDKKNFSYCIDKGQQVFFYNNSLSFRFNSINISKAPLLGLFETEEHKEERVHNAKKTTQHIDIEWLGANPNTTIVPEEKQTTNYSYLVKNTSDSTQSLACDGYSKITYKNLYPNIDVEYVFHPKEGIKYNLLLHPGADISQVKMQYSKNVKLSLKNGNIHIKTIVGEIIDHAPVTYYAENNQNIPSAFKIENNVISFDIQNINPNQEIVIDPWTVIPGFLPASIFDNGVDASGNIYIYGGGGGTWMTEKYPPTGGSSPIWSQPNLLNATTYSTQYYGDLLVESSGDFYICEAVNNSDGAHVQKFSPAGAPLWTSAASSTAMLEYWRMALNCVTGKVIVAGGGINYNVNIAQIDATTGALSNVQALNAPDDISGLCVDETGKSYTHGSMTNKISFNDANNNPIATALSGYSQSEAANPYVGSNGYNMMVLGGANFLFTSNGATLKKWDRNTHTMISSVVIPGGQPNMGSGIIADQCNNLFVGASNGVYYFDFNLVQKEFQATTTAVYDIAFAATGEIVAGGNGFLQSFAFNRETCDSSSVEITSEPCNAEINTVKVIPTGKAPFTYLWDDGNTDSVRTNLSLGDHIVSIADASCPPAIIIDTITIGGAISAMSIAKTDPTCPYSTEGQITITLLRNQEITAITWTPTVTNALLNDSTSQATGLSTGTYSCFITSSLGCSFDTTVTLASQFSNPSSDFFDAQACQNQAIQFDENSSSNVSAINSWTWDFGDNTSSNLQNPTHTYTAGGTFTTTLIVSTTSGCADTVEKQTIVHPIPTVEFFADDICEGSIAYFTDASTIAEPGIVQYWQWDFGDNTPIRNNQNTNHVYPSLGAYTTKLVVTSNYGCKDSITKTITVNPYPIVTFTASDTTGCNPLCVNFESNVILSAGSVVGYLWTYGDLDAFDNTENGYYCYNNTTGSSASPQALFFDVELTVTSDNGCVNTAKKPNYITVFPNPVANFTATPQTESIINPVIEIVDLSLNANTWLWNFGDDSTSTNPTPGEYIYADTGVYVINLKVTNQYLCSDSTSQIVIIEPDWAFFVPNAFSPNGDGKNETFGGQGYGVLEYQMFIYNRWGDQVFATDSMDKSWDGKANLGALKAQTDVYVYKINIRDIKRKKHEFTGTVTIVR